jgi:hypothetical protein
VLALAYFGLEGLPQDLHLEMGYFEVSPLTVHRFILYHPCHRKVVNGSAVIRKNIQKGVGVGMIGISKGAEIALGMSTLSPLVRINAILSVGQSCCFD